MTDTEGKELAREASSAKAEKQHAVDETTGPARASASATASEAPSGDKLTPAGKTPRPAAGAGTDNAALDSAAPVGDAATDREALGDAVASGPDGELQMAPIARPRRQRDWQTTALLIASVSLGIVAATMVALQTRAPDPERSPPPPVSFLGESLVLDRQATLRALDRARAHVRQPFTVSLPDGTRHIASFGELGVDINRTRLEQLIRDAADRTSPLRRVRAQRGLSGTPLALPVPLELNQDRALDLLGVLKEKVDRPSRDAKLDLKSRRVLPSETGYVLDVDASLVALRQALSDGKTAASVAVVELPPRRRTAQLQNVRFDKVLAAFETHYDRSMRSQARSYNLGLAASRLDGYVLMPGEVFDFNKVVGPRDEANGYKVAAVIAEGEVVDGVGGGTCQVSGTLHGAAFFAGLQIIERATHTRPSSYIKLGLDATVVYPTLNFRFRNTLEHPVVLKETVDGGTVRAEILGPASNRTVTLIRSVKSAERYQELERPDPRVPRGQRVLLQRGIPGFTLKVFRIVREGDHAQREQWTHRYPPTPQLVAVGTGPRGQENSLNSDHHAEYKADELLIITQMKPEQGGTPSLNERRVPGRFGTPGWTKRAGMRLFETDGT